MAHCSLYKQSRGPCIVYSEASYPFVSLGESEVDDDQACFHLGGGGVYTR